MKINQEMKNDIATMKNSIESIKSRLKEPEDCISELEDKMEKKIYPIRAASRKRKLKSRRRA